MARKRVRRIESLICNTVRDLVFPTSVGLGLVVAGCGGSSGDSDSSGAGPVSTAVSGEAGPERMMDAPLYAILPPRSDAAADATSNEAEAGRDAVTDALRPRDTSRADRLQLDAPPIFAVLPPREV